MNRIILLVPPAASRGGVADYTHRLAKDLEARGVVVRCVLLPEKNELHSWIALRQEMATFQPDAISISFVPYGFDPKGVAGGWKNVFQLLHGPWKIHWMFHELWIGDSTEYGLKDRLIGWLQRRGIQKLLRTLPPDVAHTTNPVYRQMLVKVGVRAKTLPLFGNIPVATITGNSPLQAALSEQRIDRAESLCLGFFGMVHSPWKPDEFVPDFVAHAKRSRKLAVICSVGRQGPSAERLWEVWETRFPDVLWIRLGEQSPEGISLTLQDLDAGLNTTPWALINKSGSAAAMREHGLPVIVVRDDFQLRKACTPTPVVDSGLHLWQRGADPKWWTVALKPDRPSNHLLSSSVSIFLKDLNATKGESGFPLDSTITIDPLKQNDH